MKTVSIIGWYGTETMGDRAILDGIFSVLSEIIPECCVKLGSLYPFYSERTLYEERDVLKQTAPKIKTELFDIKEQLERENAIKESDLILVGGGPLMDLEELFLLKKCFEQAKIHNIPTIIMGCGIGPLMKSNYRECVKNLFELSTAIWVRDRLSLMFAKELWGDCFSIEYVGDPAVISVENYKKRMQNNERNNTLAINFREYPGTSYGKERDFSMISARHLLEFVKDKYEQIVLYPMHTFGIGNDDRLFLSRLLLDQQYENIRVMHKPLNLYELYECYANAKACVGMRYHSIVLQTILNGNNIVINYTDPKYGKIRGFLENIGAGNFYQNRILELSSELDYTVIYELEKGNHYQYTYSEMKKEYVEHLKKHL